MAIGIFDDCIDIKNERDPAVAKDCGRGNSVDAPIIGLETLDHDLALSLNGIDEKGTSGMALEVDQNNDALIWICSGMVNYS